VIVFQSDRPNALTAPAAGQIAIWKVDLPGNGSTQLTFPPAGQDDSDPVLSHNGDKVAFSRGVAGNRDIYVLDLNQPTSATNPQRITNATGDDGHPAWSPNDSMLVFASNRNAIATNFNIYTCNATGTESNVSPNLTSSNTGPDERPQWSPDGTSILYQAKLTTSSNEIVYSMPSGGGAQTPHTSITGTVDNGWPRYSPDGQYIIYHRQQGNRQILFKPANAAPGVGEVQIHTLAVSVTGHVQPFWGKP
jgi:Tol biopolymer transport system component